jgi:hypothetical protein
VRVRRQLEARAAAKAAAFAEQNAALRQQVTSFFFKAKQRGVVPAYASLSLNEHGERAGVSRLTAARRWKRAALAKVEEAGLFANSYGDEVRRSVFIFVSSIAPFVRSFDFCGRSAGAEFSAYACGVSPSPGPPVPADAAAASRSRRVRAAAPRRRPRGESLLLLLVLWSAAF